MFTQGEKTFVNQRKGSLSNKLAGHFARSLPFLTGQEVSRTENSRVRQRQPNITVTERQGQIPVAILHLHGSLNASCYLDLIAKAKEIYGAGTQHIILDMSDISSVGTSSMLALHSITVLLRGEEPLDPQGGWDTLRAVTDDLKTGSLQEHFKLFNPKPQVWAALEQAGFVGFLEIHTDLDTAITSFQAGYRH